MRTNHSIVMRLFNLFILFNNANQIHLKKYFIRLACKEKEIGMGDKEKEYSDVERDFMIKALERLRNNMRSNQTIFNGYISYITKLEYTPDRGWHYHMAFIFNGALRQSEYGIAQQLVSYWQTVIAGMVGNGNIVCGAEYPTNGTGMVHYADLNKIKAVKYALSYLAKKDINTVNKVFVDSTGRNQQSFFMGQYVPKNSNRGRPRNT